MAFDRRLENANAHERDARIYMDESTHTYYVDGEPWSESVSAILHQYFTPFNAASVIATYYERWKKAGKYTELIRYLQHTGSGDDQCRSSIENYWKSKGTGASTRGTYVHLQIEMALNGAGYDEDLQEIQQYHAWKKEVADARGWVPYRTEWSVFDAQSYIAGQIDSIWKDREGRLHMVDWKCCDPTPRSEGNKYTELVNYIKVMSNIDNEQVRSRLKTYLISQCADLDGEAYAERELEIAFCEAELGTSLDLLGPHMSCFKNKCGLGACSLVPDTKYGHYVVQQNAYKNILERCYGVSVESMHLLQMHPKMTSYHFVEIVDAQEAIASIFTDREIILANFCDN